MLSMVYMPDRKKCAASVKKDELKGDLASCVKYWDQDRWNDRLWNRVTDVNADRSNQVFSRPRAGTQQGCQFRSLRLDQRLFDTCNLPDYANENHLRRMYLINNRDVLDYHYRTKCHDRCDRDKILAQQTINIEQECHPIYLRARTKELYRTIDHRPIWSNPPLPGSPFEVSAPILSAS
jgi:hypothetical protein